MVSKDGTYNVSEEASGISENFQLIRNTELRKHRSAMETKIGINTNLTSGNLISSGGITSQNMPHIEERENPNSYFNANNLNSNIFLNILNKMASSPPNHPKGNVTPPSSESSIAEEEEELHNSYIKHLRSNEKLKTHFEKLKHNRFNITLKEMLWFTCCPNKGSTVRQKTLIGGVNRITSRTDIVYILKKNLEFDRFKNLMLKEYQLILLNSLTKFMLDPEKVNLVDFEQCSYEKFIDSYEQASSGLNLVDRRLCRWVSPKFKFDIL